MLIQPCSAIKNSSGTKRYPWIFFSKSNFSISEILSEFLDRVCSGRDELAEVHPSLEFLGFGVGFGVGVTSFAADIVSAENFIKSEPDNLSFLEPETVFEPTIAEVDADESVAVDGLDDVVPARAAGARTRKRRQRYDVDDDVDDDNDPDFLMEHKSENEDK